MARRPAHDLVDVGAVGEERAALDPVPPARRHRQSLAGGEVEDARPLTHHQPGRDHDERVDALPQPRLEGRVDLRRPPGLQGHDAQTELGPGRLRLLEVEIPVVGIPQHPDRR